MKILSKTVFVTFLTAVALLVIAASLLPKMMGWVPLAVLSDSMAAGGRPAGTLLVVKPLNSESEKASLAIDDLASFYTEPNNPASLTTHRVVGVEVTDAGPVYTTKGDSNNSADAPVLPKQVAGKTLYSIPLIGHVAVKMNGTARTVAIQAIGVGLLLYGVAVAVMPGLRRKKPEAVDPLEPAKTPDNTDANELSA